MVSHRRDRDVDAGQGTLLLGIVFLLAYLMESSIRVQEQSATGRGSRVPGCPLNHVFSYVYNLLDVSVTSMPRALILVVRNCLSPRTDTIYVDVSVSNTSRALILVRIARLYGYWYVIPSQSL